jgi:hypothetical protein
MAKKVLIPVLSICIAGCASERLQVTVTDSDGNPISNAVVHVGFSTSHVIFGGGHTSSKKGGHAEAKTDTNGIAVVWFNCTSSVFGWHVEADGYYRSESYRGHFKGEDVIIPPAFGYVILHEHEKEGKTTIWRKINPQPMYSYCLSEAWGNAVNKVPVKNGRYGFDLRLGSWLPPLGKGEVADFYYVRNIGEEPLEDGSVAWLEFDSGCGAYFGKQTGSKVFPSTYGANKNAEFRNRLPFMFVKRQSTDKRIDWRDIATDDEYMVLRTRAKLDAKGNVIEANYSKILGPFRFGYAVESPCVVFNHRVNDTNLESDCRRNMLKQFNSNGYPP